MSIVRSADPRRSEEEESKLFQKMQMIFFKRMFWKYWSVGSSRKKKRESVTVTTESVPKNEG